MRLIVLLALLCVSGGAFAWGDEGHQVTALIAYRHLNTRARAALDALLASDPDPLTAADFASRASWADRYRDTHRETAAWHYVNIEVAKPDLEAACFHYPPVANDIFASFGPAQDCIVNKIEQFQAELKDPHTPPAERLLAFKFLIHFVGDLHQPLHAADRNDRGGNCVGLSVPGAGGTNNLHAYWDVSTVQALGANAAQIAAQLDGEIAVSDLQAWSRGGTADWAMESFQLARKDVYALPAAPTCQSSGAVSLSADYAVTAQRDTALQLKRAGVRMAMLLNVALGT